MSIRNLHGDLPAPYYVYALDYRETSSGICVLHYLCHALNISGHEAYVVLCNVVNPALRTPILTDEIIQRHKDLGRTPIVVYPEVVAGNPFSGPVVVRYILNREGFLTGNSVQPGKNDLFFYYAADFGDGTNSANMMTLPVIDSALFCPPTAPVQRTKSYLYLHRHLIQAVDFNRLPADVEILSLANPKTLAQLADIFKEAAVLYSYEISATCTEAMLCGCPVVYLQGGHIDSLPFPELFGDAGATMYGEPGGLERARASLPEARMRWLDIETSFWGQFDTFIELTQQEVVDYKSNLRTPQSQWLQARTLSAVQKRLIAERKAQAGVLTSLTVIVLDRDDDAVQLAQTLESFAQWQPECVLRRTLVLSPSVCTQQVPDDTQWHTLADNVAAQINTLLQTDHGHWFVVLNAGDKWQANGALRLELELANHEQLQMLYFDEIHVDGASQGIALRPDFNLDMLLGLPVSLAGRWLFRRTMALEVNGFDPAFAEALEFDLILRMIERNGIDTIGHIDEPLLACAAPTLEQNDQEIQAIKRHLLARNYQQARVVEGPARHYHVQYGHLDQPMVSIIVHVKNHLATLQRCVETILEKTAYQRYEILLVDNESDAVGVREWLSNMEAIGGQKVRVLRYHFSFNLAAIYNMAAEYALGEYLVMMPSYVAVLTEDWLDNLLNHAQRPEVGIVGSKLVYPDATLQHAGVVLGLHGPAGHPGAGESSASSGYMQRRWLDQNASAVTAAGLIIRKSIYVDVAGMDEELFRYAYSDIDLCLKVGKQGYLIVWTPHSLLLHDSAGVASDIGNSQDHFVGEQDAMYARWLPKLASDPAYNRNLSLSGNGFELESITALTWQPLSWRPLPVVLAYSADVAQSDHDRVINPLSVLKDNAVIDGYALPQALSVVDLQRYRPDVLVMHRCLDEERLETMRRASAFSSSFKVFDLDIDLSTQMLARSGDTPSTSQLTALGRGLEYVDRFVVATAYLADLYSGFHSDIRLVENRLLPEYWANMQPLRRNGSKPRVGVFGEMDFHLLDNVIPQLANEVEWILVGKWPEKLRAFAAEVHLRPPVMRRAQFLSSLELDLALAPLDQTRLNDSKDKLLLLEYGACGYPVVCSDVRAYQGNLPVTRVRNLPEAWLDAIRAHLHDLPAAMRIGEQLRATVHGEWMLDASAIHQWQEVWLP